MLARNMPFLASFYKPTAVQQEILQRIVDFDEDEMHRLRMMVDRTKEGIATTLTTANAALAAHKQAIGRTAKRAFAQQSL